MAYIISSGESSDGIILENDSLTVLDGGTATDITLDDWGRLYVSSGGTANSTTVNPNGALYVDSSGTATNIVENGGYVTAESKTTVVSFAPNTFGNCYLDYHATLHSGTTASNIVFSDLTVYDGGVAESACTKTGTMVLSSGGTANNTVLSGGRLYISKGGVANNTEVSFNGMRIEGLQNGSVFVSAGGTANGTVLKGLHNSSFNYQGGVMNLQQGGVANNTSVCSGGVLNISNGAVANNTVVEGHALLDINDESADFGIVNVLNNGKANGVTVNPGGMLVVAGGSAQGIVENGGYVSAQEGRNVTYASNTFSGLLLSAIYRGGISATVHSGTTAVDITLMSGARINLYSSGKLTGRLINVGGVVSVASDAIIDFDLMRTAPGATALFNDYSCIKGSPTFTITVDADQAEGVYKLAENISSFKKTISVVNTAGDKLGTLTVGETTDISGVGYLLTLSEEDKTLSLKIGETETPSQYTSDGWIQRGETLEIKKNEVFHDVVILPTGTINLVDSGSLDSATVFTGGSLSIAAGCTATEIREDGGFVKVQKGATVTFARHTISNSLLGNTTLHSGTTAVNIKLTGSLFIYEGGAVDGVEAITPFRNPGDSFTVFVSGGTATAVKLSNKSCTMYVSSGGTANNTLVTAMPVSKGGGTMFVSAGGSATGTIIDSGGTMFVSAGGTTTDTTIRGGEVQLKNSAGADRISVWSGAYLDIASGASVSNIMENGGFVQVRGSSVTFASNTINGLFLSSASATVHSCTTAVAPEIGPNGAMFVYEGGIANFATIKNNGRMDIFSGGITDHAVINANGSLNVSSGGIANYAAVNTNGALINGGTVNNTLISGQGSMFVTDGGMTVNLSVNSGGRVDVLNGGKLTGQMSFESDAVVSMWEGGIIDFDLTQAEAGAEALVNDLSIIQGTPLYTLTVNGEQAKGIYALADGAADFSGTITVQNTAGESLGTLTVGISATFSDVDYELGLIDDVLSLQITPPAIVSGAVIENDSRTVLNGQTYIETTINSAGGLVVSSDGTANSTIVNSKGSMFVSGTANDTMVNSYGSLTISKGGVGSNVLVGRNGGILISSGGKLTGKVTCLYGTLSATADAIVDFDLTHILPGAAALYFNTSVPFVRGTPTYTITVEPDQAHGIYSLVEYTNQLDDPITIQNPSGTALGTISVGETITVSDTSYTLNLEKNALTLKIGEDITPSPYTSDGLVMCKMNRTVAFGEVYHDTLVWQGQLIVDNGGIANETTVHSQGKVNVSSGGSANSIIVNADTFLYVSSDGTATNIVENGGDVEVEDGATVSFLPNTFSGMTLGPATVHSGTTAISNTIERGCSMFVYSGGLADNTVVNDVCDLGVFSGGIVTNTIVNKTGRLFVYSDGNANSTTVKSRGWICVSNGGTANGVTVSSGGSMIVTEDALLTGKMTFEKGAKVSAREGAVVNFDLTQTEAGAEALVNDLSIIQGTPLYTLTVDASLNSVIGTYSLADGAAEFNSTISVVNTAGKELGTLTVGETVMIGSNSYTLTLTDSNLSVMVNTQFIGLVLENSSRTVASGQTYIDTTVNYNGRLFVSNGGTATDTTVNVGGSMHVSSGGTALNVMENGGYVSVAEGADVTFAVNTLSGLIVSRDLLVHSGTTANSTTISEGRLIVSNGGIASNTFNYGGYLEIYSGGTVNNTLLTSPSRIIRSGIMIVYSGGTANNTVIDYGRLTISGGGTAVNTVLNYLGEAIVSSGGTADGAMVGTACILSISSDGTALNVKENGGIVNIASGANVTFASNTFSGLKLDKNSATVHSGTTAVAANLTNKDARLLIFSGGVAENTINSGHLIVSSGGTAIGTILQYGELVVSSGGTADGTTVNSGEMYAYASGTANGTTLNGGRMIVFSGMADIVLVNGGGYLSVYKGGTATNIVETGGCVSFADGADVMFVSHTIYDLSLLGRTSTTVHSGTTVCNLFIGSGFGKIMNVYSGGKLTGKIIASGGATISAHDGAIIDFNLTTIAPGAAVLIDSRALSLIQGTPTYTITVNADQTEGIYRLAEGASEFDQTITVVNIAGVDLGTLTIGETNNVSGVDYTLFLSEDGVLSLKVGETETPSPYTSDGLVARYSVLDVLSGQVFHDISIAQGGRLTVSSGGVLNEVNVISSGSLFVANGGTATEIVENGGYVSIEDGAEVSFIPHAFTVVGSHFYGTATVHAGTTAYNMDGGTFLIYSGGVANNNGGTFYVYSGGVANNNGGMFYVYSGGVANSTIVYGDGGGAKVFSGGTINGTIFSGGTIFLSGGTANDTFFARKSISAFMIVADGGTANNTVVGIGVGGQNTLLICSGGTANNTTLNSGGHLNLWHGNDLNGGIGCGVANNTTVNSGGIVDVISGTANRITVYNGGTVIVGGSGKVTGKLTFEKGAVVSMQGGAVLDFDLTQTEAGAETLVNDLSIIQGTPKYTLTVNDNWKQGSFVYSLADGAAEFNGVISVVNTAGDELGTLTVGKTVKIGYDDYTLNLKDASLSVTIIKPDMTPQTPVGTTDQVTWEASGAAHYTVEYSTDNFKHVISLVTAGNAVDTPELPTGTYQWRVKADANSEWAVGEAIAVEPEPDAAPKVVQAVEDGNDDLFFATTNGTWSDNYYALHVGSVNDWTGTKDMISASGKGRIQNLFFGSADPNVLCLTDSENGDAIFVDDAYTGLPEDVEANTARLYKIQEIRAGAGDDIVDMTSQRCEYTGDGLTIRGGDGDDTIWANKGGNMLFGDAGNDRIVGASGNDVIAGGIGNDSMHGGGGDDVFAFCDNWGADTVEQLETGTVTLWFASGSSENWNAETLTYSNGESSVTVKGVTADQVFLKFGSGNEEDAVRFATLSDAGAFDNFTSQKIFEKSGSGIIASQ